MKEQPQHEVGIPLVSLADMRRVLVFVMCCMVWWRYMIRGYVVGL